MRAAVKITAPKDPDEYFAQTAEAVKHAYAGLDACWAHYDEALRHWDVSKINEPMTPENRAALDRYFEHANRYFGQKFSEAMHAGSILQAAYMAIKLYSRNTAIPASCAALVPARHPAAAFCVGQERYGISSGLIVYAGRNQYAHWDDDEPHKVTANVFNALTSAFINDMFSDLAFEISNPSINIYASEILFTALRWNKYDRYLAEMSAMLDAT